MRTVVPNSSYVVRISRYQTDHGLQPIAVKTISGAVMDEEVMFNVDSAVIDWQQHMKRNPEVTALYGFKIEVEGDDGPERNVQFVHSHDGSDKRFQPQLVIYSYDHEALQIDYNALMQLNDEVPSGRKRRSQPDVSGRKRHSQPDIAATTAQGRGKRQAESTSPSPNPPPTCHVHSLAIEASHLELFHTFQKDHLSILAPASFNAGICGGVCSKRFPYEYIHSSFVYLLIHRDVFADKNYDFVQSCSPVRYDHIDFLTTNPAGVVAIKRLNNMIIRKCECLDVVSYASNDR